MLSDIFSSAVHSVIGFQVDGTGVLNVVRQVDDYRVGYGEIGGDTAAKIPNLHRKLGKGFEVFSIFFFSVKYGGVNLPGRVIQISLKSFFFYLALFCCF